MGRPASSLSSVIAPPRVIGKPASYWQASRAPRYSLLFALPLLVLYERRKSYLPRSIQVC